MEGILSESRHAEINDAPERQETGRCGHFSIRKYVAETCKRDWKSCWPFAVPQDLHKLEDFPDFLSSLPTPDFGWWDCQTCLKKTDANRVWGGSGNSLVGKRIDSTPSSGPLPNYTSPNVVPHGFQLSSAENACESRDADKNGLLSNLKNKDASVLEQFSRVTSEDMIQNPHSVPDDSAVVGNMKQIKYGTTCGMTEDESCTKGERTPTEITVVKISLDLNKPASSLFQSETASTIKPVSFDPVVPSEDFSKQMKPSILMENREAHPIAKNGLQIVDESFATEDDESKVNATRGKSPATALSPASEFSLMGLTESDDDLPGNNMTFAKNETPLCTSTGSLQKKRARKMRLLTDILRSEHFGISKESIGNFIMDKGNKQRKLLEVENSELPPISRPMVLPEVCQNCLIGDKLENDVTLMTNFESRTEFTYGSDVRAKENRTSIRKERPNLTQEEHIDTAQRRDITTKKSKKVPRIEDLNSLPKDYSGMTTAKAVINYQENEHPIVMTKKAAQTSKETLQAAAFDDIPMDIVELLATNQLERRLQSAQVATEATNNKPRTTRHLNGFNMIDFTGKSIDHCEGPGSCSYTNSRSKNVASKQPERSHEGFVPWSQSKQKQEVGFSSSNLSPDHAYWSLTCSEWLEQCHKNQLGLLKYSSGLTNCGASVALPAVSSKYNSVQASPCANVDGHFVVKMTSPCYPVPYQKKKVRCLSATNNETGTPCAFSNVDKANVCNPNMVAPMDICTSETIPAMHLLRLMDQGACSCKPATARIVENKDKYLQRNHVTPSNSHKFFEIETGGVSETGRPLLHPKSFQRLNQKQHVGSSFDVFPPLEKYGALGPILPEVHSNYSNYRLPVTLPPEFNCGIEASSSHSQRKKKPDSGHSLGQTVGFKQRDFLSILDLPLRDDTSQRMGDLTGLKVKENKKGEIALPVRGSCSTEMCTLNRNPAEFSIPEAGNAYMIGSEDLKCRNWSALKEFDGRKRQKMVKLAAIQGH